jgi:hypothetical protein
MMLPPLQNEVEFGTYTSFIQSLIIDLNEQFSTGLCEVPVINRFMDEEVCLNEETQRQNLLLIGASLLNWVADQFNLDKWELTNLCQPGFRNSEESVAEITGEIEELKKMVQLENSTVILQLCDNTVYQIGGLVGTKHLPT